MKWINTLWLFLFSFSSWAQSSSEIYHQVLKLNTLVSVLYIAAHPDDENTRLITHFTQHENARTAYLSLTRGDGGQNLIGPELREGLGFIRTHELLQARKIDGGEQFFSSANDFGYSKTPDETLQIWDKNRVLDEMVHIIQSFRPDIIVNRFDHRTPGRTHGHHTTSAQLSLEAFEKAARENGVFGTQAWQTKRLYFNTSWWFYGSREKFEAAPKDKLLALEVGQYNSTTGKFHGKIAAKSRSQHKSQGFGSRSQYQTQTEYLEVIKGQPTPHPFTGIDTSWGRLQGGQAIGQAIEQLLKNFDFKAVEKNLGALFKIRAQIAALSDSYWKEIKLAEVDQIIQDCLGLELFLHSKTPTAVKNDDLSVEFKAYSPTKIAVQIERIKINTENHPIGNKIPKTGFEKSFDIKVPEQLNSPYWLLQKGQLGMYKSAPQEWIGFPETPAAVRAQVILYIDNHILNLEVPLTYSYTDPVRGEVTEIFQILPEVTAACSQDVYLFTDQTPQPVSVSIQVHSDNFKGQLELCYPNDWEVEPANFDLSNLKKGEQRNFEFKARAPKNSSVNFISPLIRSGEQVFDKGLQIIDYDHIPKRYLLQPSEAKVVRLDATIPTHKIGYLAGAGDRVAEHLKSIGIEVVSIDPKNFTLQELNQVKTVVVGIRAFNVHPELSYRNKILWEFVQRGGKLVIQYNTTRGLKTNEITPIELQLSRKRITDENASVRILDPTAQSLQKPNLITVSDFEGWVQERGLYFPDQWDDSFKPLLEFNDPNEAPLQGSLLEADYGEGKIIYTGLSFFRQLPAGVPGAYRLFLNLLSNE